ncbi:MAG: hypothetical protein MZU97_07935 [Bacillus subtilis]|nr:hypothetical protein [Bacillus subtilis]
MGGKKFRPREGIHVSDDQGRFEAPSMHDFQPESAAQTARREADEGFQGGPRRHLAACHQQGFVHGTSCPQGPGTVNRCLARGLDSVQRWTVVCGQWSVDGGQRPILDPVSVTAKRSFRSEPQSRPPFTVHCSLLLREPRCARSPCPAPSASSPGYSGRRAGRLGS